MAAYELTTKVVATGVGTVVVIKIPVGNLDWSPKEKELYLNGNDKHIYMSFLHLDAGKTLNNTALGWQSETVTLGKDRTIKVAPTVSAKTPTEVKKGQIIGFLGTPDTNGGWMAHAHVNLYTNRAAWLSPNHFSKPSNQANIDKRVDEYKTEKDGKITYRQVGNIGVEGVLNPKGVNEVNPATGEIIKNKKLDELPAYVDTISMLSREQSKGYADPNLVYKLRDSRTFAFGIEDLFELNK